jgi:integrase
MAQIEKRSHPTGKITWRARIRRKGWPDISESFPTKKEATEWTYRMETEVRAGRYFGRAEEQEHTFEQFIDRFIENELPKNPKGYKKQQMLLSWWKAKLGKYFLCHITPAMIAELRDSLMRETTRRGTLRSPATTNRYLAALSHAYTICQKEWHWIKENPVSKISKPKESRGRERYLEKDEINRLLGVCKKSKSPYLYAITLFALGTGARKGEILNLRWNDVDFSRCTAIFRDTKNGESRTIHLSDTIANCLREEQQKRLFCSEYVFPSQDGKRPADIKAGWENAVEEAGLVDVCFHTLRHTAASHLAIGGFSSLEIASVLGHKTLAMVKRYSHLSLSATARALDRLNDTILGEAASG